jgi:hypothetical protein
MHGKDGYCDFAESTVPVWYQPLRAEIDTPLV